MEIIPKDGFWQTASNRFPGAGQEFMPTLNEGSFLLMPTTMPHTGIEQNIEYVGILDKRISNIPEVEMAVGKWGRLPRHSILHRLKCLKIQLHRPEYILDQNGNRKRFKVNRKGEFILTNNTTY